MDIVSELAVPQERTRALIDCRRASAGPPELAETSQSPDESGAA